MHFLFLIAVSKKFQLDLIIVRVRELNFVLRLEIFVHYDGQLQTSHLILGCATSYPNYQDSSTTLTIGSPFLSYLDVRLSGFLPHRLMRGEAQHQGPRRVRQGSLEPVRDSLADTLFHNQVEHISAEALIPLNPIEGMVQQRTMPLIVGSQAHKLPRIKLLLNILPSKPLPMHPVNARKRQRDADIPTTEYGIAPTNQPPTPALGMTTTQLPSGTPQETRPTSQPIIIRSQVASTSAPSSSGWECSFQLCEKVLPSDSPIQTWRSDLRG